MEEEEGVWRLPILRSQELGEVGFEKILLLPSCFIFGMITPLHFVESDGAIASYPVLLIKNSDGVFGVGEVFFQLFSVGNDHINWRFETFLELGYMKHVMHPSKILR
mgnify:CR=1 FL=1